MGAGDRLRSVLNGEQALIVPGVYDPLGALLAKAAGLQAVYISGFALAASLGREDVGLTTATEIADRARYIVEAVDLPVIVDCDQGFGGLRNGLLTLKLMESAGAAAIQVEDQPFPKKSGSMTGLSILPKDEARRKIHALASARTTDVVLIGRTDSIPYEGIDSALDRLKAYLDAGADYVMPIGLRSEEEMAMCGEAFPDKWFMVLSEASMPSPILPLRDYTKYRAAVVLYATSSLWRTCKTVLDGFRQLNETGISTFDRAAMIERPEFYRVLTASLSSPPEPTG